MTIAAEEFASVRNEIAAEFKRSRETIKWASDEFIRLGHPESAIELWLRANATDESQPDSSAA